MYIRIDNQIYNFPEKPTNEDIYEAQIIDGVPTWVVPTKTSEQLQQEAYQVYQDKLLELKSEDEFNLFLYKTEQITQQDYDDRLVVITSDLVTAKNTYLGV